jgi:hypothetical protein
MVEMQVRILPAGLYQYRVLSNFFSLDLCKKKKNKNQTSTECYRSTNERRCRGLGTVDLQFRCSVHELVLK